MCSSFSSSSTCFLPSLCQLAAMKRPGSAKAKASQPPLKKPAACGEGTEEEEAPPEEKHVELTAEAVKDHNKFCEEAKDMSVEQFEAALSKLDDKASQRLWKAF